MNRNSRRAQRICLDTHLKSDERGYYMTCSCGKCKGLRIDPVRDKWRADHNRRWAEGGRDTPDNLFPILERCDAGVGGKAAEDTKTIAHGKRMSDRHFGVKDKRRGFKGHRRFDGTIVWK